MTEQFDELWERICNPTREQRIEAAYRQLAGSYPGPNRAIIAAILAHRLVELEGQNG